MYRVFLHYGDERWVAAFEDVVHVGADEGVAPGVGEDVEGAAADGLEHFVGDF